MRTSQLGPLIDPKSDSSVSKVVQTTTTMDRSSTTKETILNAILRKIGCYGVRIDTHLLEMKEEEATYGTKDDQCQVISKLCLPRTQKPRLPTKDSFKGGSPPSTLNNFLSSLSKSRDEISFKGGSLSHPKIWNVKINKNRNHVLLVWI
jgi:hypothetical protein